MKTFEEELNKAMSFGLSNCYGGKTWFCLEHIEMLDENKMENVVKPFFEKELSENVGSEVFITNYNINTVEHKVTIKYTW